MLLMSSSDFVNVVMSTSWSDGVIVPLACNECDPMGLDLSAPVGIRAVCIAFVMLDFCYMGERCCSILVVCA